MATPEGIRWLLPLVDSCSEPRRRPWFTSPCLPFQRSIWLDGRVRSFSRSGKPYVRTRGIAVSRKVYDKAPTKQMFSIPIAFFCGSGHTKIPKPRHSTPSFICKKVCRIKGSRSKTNHPSCDSPNTSRRFALGARKCLPHRCITDRLRPGIAGMQGSMVL